MSKRFVPPKLDMGPDFQKAAAMKAKHKSQVSSGTPTITQTTSNPKPRITKKSHKDTIPLTLSNLALYFDWRRALFEQSPTLYKIATAIWSYLDQIKMEQYSVNFGLATENSILPNDSFTAPPCLITTSPRGDLLVMVVNRKKLPEYYEKQFLLILYPRIDNIRFIEDVTVKTSGGEHCTYWEIEGMEHLTHIAMDKYGIIYFTTGESVFRIVKTEGDMYLDSFEDIFSPSNDTSHITCLWRQSNDIYLTIQDWDNEENLDVYKLIPPKDRGVSTPDSPTGSRGTRSPSFGKKNRSRSNSGYGSDFSSGSPRGRGTANDSNEFVNKVRTFSLSYNQRIWQLGSMNFQKKFILAIGAAQCAYKPQLLQIGFKKKIKAFGLNGPGKGNKKIVWPKSAPEDLPHAIYPHKPTKSWFCILPVTHQKYKDGRLFWVQFKMDKSKKKVSWQRLVAIPDEAKQGDWLYYDDLRDVLIGFSHSDKQNEEYVFKYLPDITKYLWIAGSNKDEDDLKSNKSENGPVMTRAIRARRKSNADSKQKKSETRRKSGTSTATAHAQLPHISPTTSNEHNIKPSQAKKVSSTNDIQKFKRRKKVEPKKKIKKKSEPKKKAKKKKKSEPKKKVETQSAKKEAPVPKKEELKLKKKGLVDVSKIKPKVKKNGGEEEKEIVSEESVEKLAEVAEKVVAVEVEAKNAKNSAAEPKEIEQKEIVEKLAEVVQEVIPLKVERKNSKKSPKKTGYSSPKKSGSGYSSPKKNGSGYTSPPRTGSGYSSPKKNGSGYKSPRQFGYSSPRRSRKQTVPDEYDEEDVMD